MNINVTNLDGSTKRVTVNIEKEDKDAGVFMFILFLLGIASSVYILLGLFGVK